MFLCFHIGADYLINFPEGKLPGARGGLIGLAPQPLVSARSCLHRAFSTRLSAGFAQDCRAGARAGLGFPEFTQFFNHSHLWKLQFS